VRRISKRVGATIYFKIAPFTMGEGFLIGSIVLLYHSLTDAKSLLAIGVGMIGGYLLRRRYVTAKEGTYILTYGEATESVLIHISSTNSSHNGRNIKHYQFQYEVEGDQHIYSFKSAYHRELEEGNRLRIFYLKDNPQKAFIPSLYELDIQEKHMPTPL
jgi:hypothetical protein